MCIVCRKRMEKEDLIRMCIVSGKVVLDEKKSIPGRGAYVCDTCLDRAMANYKGCLDRAFRTDRHLVLERPGQ